MRRAFFSLLLLLPALAAPAHGQWTDPVPVPYDSTWHNYQFIVAPGDTFWALWTSGSTGYDSAVAYASWALGDSWSRPESLGCTDLAWCAAAGVDGAGRIWFLRFDGDVPWGGDQTYYVVASVREPLGWRTLPRVLRCTGQPIHGAAELEFATDRLGQPRLGICEHVHEGSDQYWSARFGRLQGDTCTWPRYVTKGDTAPNRRSAGTPLLEPRPDSGMWSACVVWDSTGARVRVHLLHGDTALLLQELGYYGLCDAAVDSAGRLWLVCHDSLGRLWSARVGLDSLVEQQSVTGRPWSWDGVSVGVDNEGWAWCTWTTEDSTTVVSWNRGGAWSAPERAANASARYSRLVPDSHGLMRLFFSGSLEQWYCVRRLSRPGIEDGASGEERGTSGATVVRGTLNLSSTFDCRFPIALQDVSGRNVLTLRPGANDVRHLPAGVYFLRSTVGNRQSKMSRVVIAR